MVIPSVASLGECSLGVNGPTKFSAPNNERLIQHSALFKVGKESCTCLIGILTLIPHLLGKIPMRVPAPVHNLHHAHATLDKSSGQKRT